MAWRLAAALAVVGLMALVGYAQPSMVVVGHSDGPATWMSTEVADAAPKYPYEDRPVQVRMRLEGGSISFYAGCNSQDGTAWYRVGGRIIIPALSGTLAGCTQLAEARDSWLLNFLQAEPHWTEGPGRIELTAESRRMVFRSYQGPDPWLPVIGTRWSLATRDIGLAEPDAVDPNVEPRSYPYGYLPPILVRFDGTSVEATVGCAVLSGPAVVSGADVSVGEVRASGCARDLPAAEHVGEVVLSNFRGSVFDGPVLHANCCLLDAL